ncbi:hypothetical protein [Luteimonas fraxinea]|uniref:hypothetical protein n=1 Tax=Luteimonas fraxinea TaxID=2901869 RepID=UPI001E55F5E0|nr:hypothetical protein [Luteimonas fraxinea]MCD9126021.1 hypothetical protein [Luteimonas fraxinea]
MADLSELSVVISLRDWQWLNIFSRNGAVETFVPLTGKSDQLMGDILIEPNDRLLLIEAKSKRGKVSDECQRKIVNRTNNGVTSQVQKVKNAFLKARAELLQNSPQAPGADSPGLRDYCRKSLAGHHFLYWYPTRPEASDGSVEGALALEPYLLAVARDGGFDPALGPFGNETPADAAAVGEASQFVEGNFLEGSVVSEDNNHPDYEITYQENSPFSLDNVYFESGRLSR